jgi:beta-glucosidase
MIEMRDGNSAFPPDFVWGVATAAPQIEGAAFVDGKGESIWDRFCRQPGKVHHGDTLDVACDHYHRFDEDFAMMSSLGIRHHRMSLAWPRIFPSGDGAINAKGVEFYHRVFDSMARHGITPWVTLFHWDLPQSLEDRGGWTQRGVVDAFAAYADTVVQEYAAQVKHWITLNEVRCFTKKAYGPSASKAPGRASAPAVVNQTYHHALLCHGHAVRAVREHGGAGAQVGITDNCDVSIPVTESEPDIAAARAWFVDANVHILDPIYRGAYADAYLKRTGADGPQVRAGDLALIALPTDFLGLNVYNATFVRTSGEGEYQALPMPAHFPQADSPWLKITPQASYWGPRFAHEVYRPSAIYITENGCGYDDEALVAGEVLDLHRREFLRAYLRELQRAVSDGVPVHGYFAWSLLDNFEWEDGYRRRFGLVHVDFETQRRTPKLSAHYYSSIVRSNRVL